jgi:hypothetical protein
MDPFQDSQELQWQQQELDQPWDILQSKQKEARNV